jgi:hypothetical protein
MSIPATSRNGKHSPPYTDGELLDRTRRRLRPPAPHHHAGDDVLLDESPVTTPARNRENGENGANGEHGENREDGENGANGADTEPLGAVSVLSVSSPAVENAISCTLPAGAEQHRRQLFQLCRHLKALCPDADAEALRPVVQEWHRRVIAKIGHVPWTETWGEVLSAWPRVKHPVGQGAVDAAFARASRRPPPAEAEALYDEKPILLLASLCRELQQVNGDKEFYLDTRQAGRLLGIGHVSAWRLLKVLCADGILKAGDAGYRGTSKAPGKASRFRYLPHAEGGGK